MRPAIPFIAMPLAAASPAALAHLMTTGTPHLQASDLAGLPA